MTNEQINKIWECLAAIREQVKKLSYYGALLDQRRERLKEVKRRVLQIEKILKTLT